MIERRRYWGVDRVLWLERGDRVRSLPSAWTSEADEDAFVALSGGRSAFRPEDLLALAELLAGIAAAASGRVECSGGGAGVKQITPHE